MAAGPGCLGRASGGGSLFPGVPVAVQLLLLCQCHPQCSLVLCSYHFFQSPS
jgi:hypothetical protein